MKFHCITFFCFVHFVNGNFFKDVLDYAWSRTRKDLQDVPDNKSVCVVSKFEDFDKIDLQKLDGYWYEVFRTPTSIQYRHGSWRFQSNSTDRTSSSFLFTAKDRDGRCIPSLSGTMKTDDNDPFTVTLDYRGPNGNIQEELKVVFSDYSHRTLLYVCLHQDSNGQCSPGAATLLVLAREPTVSESVLDYMKKDSKKVCIESDTLIQQNGKDPCLLDLEDSRSWTKLDDDTVCKETSTCALACPTCCREQENGCIRCKCGKGEQDKSDDCVYSLTDCVGDNCQLVEKRHDCYECSCQALLRAAPLKESRISEIDDIRNCPTTCRTVTISNKLYCNCTNMDMCSPIPENVPASCKQRDERYYFDKRSGTCHAFYGSCLPDVNNFKNLKDCITTCADVCMLPLDAGRCKGSVKAQVDRYYFNRNRGVCDTFKYGGCEGNANNFESMEMCKHYCPEWMDRPESNRRPDICYQAVEKGSCLQSRIRYFYLNITRTCTSFIYSGCGKNGNHFKTLNECQQTCIGNSDEHQHPCPDVGKCPCDKVVREDHCQVCPCNDADDGDDGAGASLHWYGSLLTLMLSFLWIAPGGLF